ncbi:zinc finger BED domain-containing protein DAYSLEEPER-like [Miscanthus floridulus]|uniref:zinc finger BED domain-containing protein DAYSLEEPER-like n=1 Tax=Miscanthus floridulus TaxID=154761 RepID=UPI00345AC4FB
MHKNSVLSAAYSVSLTSDIWFGNVKEDYISVVAYYVSADWELLKNVIGLRLIEVKHAGENIAERITCVIKEYGLIDKIFSVTLDNASSNAKTMNILTPIFAGYLGPDPTIEHVDPSNQSCFSLAGRIIESGDDDSELGERRLQHAVDNQELEDSFKNLYLDIDESGAAAAASTSGSVAGT